MHPFAGRGDSEAVVSPVDALIVVSTSVVAPVVSSPGSSPFEVMPGPGVVGSPVVEVVGLVVVMLAPLASPLPSGDKAALVDAPISARSASDPAHASVPNVIGMNAGLRRRDDGAAVLAACRHDAADSRYKQGMARRQVLFLHGAGDDAYEQLKSIVRSKGNDAIALNNQLLTGRYCPVSMRASWRTLRQVHRNGDWIAARVRLDEGRKSGEEPG